MATTFVAAAENDIDALLEMIRELYIFDGVPFDAARQRPALVKLLRDETLGRAYLIRDDGETVGYTFLTFDFGLEYGGREAFIDELFVRESWRGKGVGKAALRFIEQVCRTLDVKALHLGVSIENRQAVAFYLKNGFGEPERYMLTKILPS